MLSRIQQELLSHGIQTGLHYPKPIHLQKAYRELGHKRGDFPIAEELANTSLSLPLYPGLKDDNLIHISTTINEFFKI